MQEFIVGLIVAYAACAVALRYLPKQMRAMVRAASAKLLRRLGWNAAADRLESTRGAASCADGCGSCGGCGSGDDAGEQGRFAISPEALQRTEQQKSR